MTLKLSTEGMILVGTFLTMVPVTRVGITMGRVYRRQRQRSHSNDIDELRRIWIAATEEAVRKWSWPDQLTLTLGLILQLFASLLRFCFVEV